MSRAAVIKVPSPGDPSFNERVAEILDLWAGYRNNGLNKLLTESDRSSLEPSSLPPTPETTGDDEAPSPPTSFTVTAAGFNSHRLDWKNPFDDDLYFILVYRGTVDDFTDESVDKIAYVTAIAREGQNQSVIVSGLEPDVTYYYWITAVDWSRNESAPTPSVEAAYTINRSVQDIMDILLEKIDYAHISSQLQDATDVVENIDEGVVFASNVDGHLIGMVYANTGTQTSHISIVSDSFRIINPGDGLDYSVPFIVDEDPTNPGSDIVGINGNLIVLGSIKAKSLETSSITAAYLDGGGFGDLTITSGSLTIQTSDGLVISGGGNILISSSGGLEIEASGGMMVNTGSADFLAGTDLNMYATTGNTAEMNFYTNYAVAPSLKGRLYADHSLAYFFIEGTSIDISSTVGSIDISSTTNVDIDGSNVHIDVASIFDVKNGATTYLSVNSSGVSTGNLTTYTPEVSSNSGSLGINAAGTAVQIKVGGTGQVNFSSGNMGPVTDRGVSIGGPSYMFDNVYGYTFIEGGGGYTHAGYKGLSDIEILKDIKPLDGEFHENGVKKVDVLSVSDLCTNRKEVKTELEDELERNLSDIEFDDMVRADKNIRNRIGIKRGPQVDLLIGAIIDHEERLKTLEAAYG